MQAMMPGEHRAARARGLPCRRVPRPGSPVPTGQPGRASFRWLRRWCLRATAAECDATRPTEHAVVQRGTGAAGEIGPTVVVAEPDREPEARNAILGVDRDPCIEPLD